MLNSADENIKGMLTKSWSSGIISICVISTDEDPGPVVQSWVSANPGLKIFRTRPALLLCVFLHTCFQNFRKENSY
jgi:hypothetical protein